MKDIIIMLLILLQIAVLVYLAWNAIKERDPQKGWGVAGSLFGIAVTILTLQPNYNLWGQIPWFLPTEYHKGPYNEGWYYGGWRDGVPQGEGTLTYDFFGDGTYYSIFADGQERKALSYKGEFDQGYRNGEGTVTYEDGYRDEGTFYGVWTAGKLIFRGKRWLTTETFNGYRELEIYATGAETAEEHWLGEWISVDG